MKTTLNEEHLVYPFEVNLLQKKLYIKRRINSKNLYLIHPLGPRDISYQFRLTRSLGKGIYKFRRISYIGLGRYLNHDSDYRTEIERLIIPSKTVNFK